MPVDVSVHTPHAEAPRPVSSIGNWLSVVSHLDPKYGGLSSVVPHLASLLTRSGRFHVELEAFCLTGERCKPLDYPELSISFWSTSRKTWLLDRSLTQLFRRSVAQSDGVHIHGLWEQSTFMAARSARSLRKPYIVSAHGMLEPWALRSKWAKKKLYAALVERPILEGAACLHALTQAEARNYRRFGSKRPIAVIPNGVDVPTSVSPELFLETFPGAQNKRLVIFLGRLHKKKGVDLLLRAWANVAFKWPESCLVMAGPSEGNTRAHLEALAAELGITKQIVFTGMLGSAMKWSALAAAECFVLPSYSEGLSVATLEAMGAGLPVIVTENCNLPEVAEQGAGWQIRPDVKELTTALASCLGNAQARNNELGQNGAALVRRRYSWSVVAAQMAELYTWVGGGPMPQSFRVQMFKEHV